jgi:hypothetical protein
MQKIFKKIEKNKKRKEKKIWAVTAWPIKANRPARATGRLQPRLVHVASTR